jgi:hypothetical protein
MQCSIPLFQSESLTSSSWKSSQRLMLPSLGVSNRLTRRNFTTFFRSLLLTICASCLQVCSFSISPTEKIKIKIAKNGSNQLKQAHKANQPLSCDLLEHVRTEQWTGNQEKYTTYYIYISCNIRNCTSKYAVSNKWPVNPEINTQMWSTWTLTQLKKLTKK